MESERQYLSVDIQIDNNGDVVKCEFYDYHLKETNERFLPNIKKQISQIVKNMGKWNPGKLMDKNVNAMVWLNIGLDEESNVKD